MAFILSLLNLDLKIADESVTVPIGYDDARPLSYSLLIGLTPTGGGEPEYFFCVVEANTETETETQFWSGLDTKDIITGRNREMVVVALRIGTMELLGAVNYPRIFCCTRDSHPPEKALKKFSVIERTFRMCGYTAIEQPVILGKHSWWMEREAE
jgi:hypothetical protein